MCSNRSNECPQLFLGLAAAQYFSSTTKPRGYRRHREKAGPGKNVSAPAKLLPSRVYTAKVRRGARGVTYKSALGFRSHGDAVFGVFFYKESHVNARQ